MSLPIININGLQCDPSVLEFGIQDVSASDAGRDQSGRMHKMKITQKIKIKLEWWQPSRELTSQILTKVNEKEYFPVSFWNPQTDAIETRTMYVGDRSAPVQMWNTGHAWYSKVSFDLIEA